MRSRLGFVEVLFSLLLVGGSCEKPPFDLQMQILAAPERVQPGDPIAVLNQVCNRGKQPLGPSAVEFLLRPAEVPGPDVPAYGRPVPALNPGACSVEETPVMQPSGLPDGAYRVVAVADPMEMLDDRRRANNTDESGVLGIGWRPDLIVTQVTGPPNVRKHDPFTVEVEVCNPGFDYASPVQAMIYLSPDEELVGVHAPPPPQEPDWPAGFVDVPGLPAGTCVSADGTVNAGPDPGVFYLGAIVDESDQVPELIESNNAGVGDRMGVGDGPDLVVSSLSGPPSVQNGSSFQVDTTVCNQGTDPSLSTGLSLHLSADTTITPAHPDPAGGDPEIGWRPVPPLAPGECHAEIAWASATVPADGAWNLGGYVDPHEDVMELREENNASTGPLVGVGTGPDLVVTQLAAPPSAGSPEAFDVDLEVCNQGTASSGGVPVHFYLSSDATLDTPPEGEDSEIGGVYLSGLAAGECFAGTASAWADAPTGAYYLFASADPHQDVPELVESNNERLGPQIGIGYAPDLVVTAISAPPSAERGMGFDATVRVCNQGTTPSTPTDLMLYHSRDAVIEGDHPPPGPDSWAGNLQVLDLDSGACADVTGEMWVNVETDGAYYLGALVDEYDFVPELIETNNAFVGPVMGLGQGPDLVVSLLSGPSSAMPGSGFSLDFELCNQGTMPSPSSDVHFYVSQDTRIEGPTPGGFGADPDLGFAPVPPLPPGVCHAGSAPVWLSSEVEGPHYLGAIVDEYDSVPELIESNNVRVGALVGIGTGPDLVVTSLSAPAAVPSGAPFDAQAQVCNVGVGPAPGTQVFFYLSEDDEITNVFDDPMSPDVPVGGAPVVALAAGECAAVDAPLFAGIPPGREGTWLLAAIVDEHDGVVELIESNNVLVGDPLEVTPGAP